jgi:hypothetical protein
MATITITPPPGWTNAKAVEQVIVPHLAKHGATMTLDVEKGRVKSAKVVLPRTPPDAHETDHANTTRAQIAKIRMYIQQYGWTEVE